MTWLQRVIRWALIVSATALLGLVWAGLVYGLAAELPRMVYRLRSASAPSDCRQIRPGMSSAEVLTVIEEKIQPRDQRLVGDRMVFSYGEIGCVAELDPITKRVVNAYVDTSYVLGWPDVD